jgi:ribose transport system ATP-binding protein
MIFSFPFSRDSTRPVRAQPDTMNDRQRMVDTQIAAKTLAPSQNPPPVIELRHLSMSFSGVKVLNDVNLSVQRGEIHGLVGQNGSGKSTLIKILAGFYSPDPGAELFVNGVSIPLPLQPGQFRRLGLSFVHQDLGLIPSLSVTENFRMAELSTEERWWIDWRKEHRRVSATLSRFGIELDPTAKVADLSPTDRAVLAIVRAIELMDSELDRTSATYGLLILDEPTAFLPATDKDRLFEAMHNIARARASVLFVSHDLDEVLQITDRITVLRDGLVQGTVDSAQVTKEALVEMIVGRHFQALQVQRAGIARSTDAFAVRDLYGSLLQGISLDILPGEVLGLTGLAGTGFEEVPYLLAGVHQAAAGTLMMQREHYDLREMTPAKAIAAGITLVPADRQKEGCEGSLTVADNILLPVVSRYFARFRLDQRQMLSDVRRRLDQFQVRPPRPELKYQALSGGNQQKALLAKWLPMRPRLLLLHEPTQGVDIGARQDIFRLLRESAQLGCAVVCATADYEQVATVCDRVLVFGRGGRIVELAGEEINKERIIEQCYMLMG